MHFFSVNHRSQLKHVGDFPSEEQAIRWLTAKPEDPSEAEDDVVMYISIDDVRRLVQLFLNNCLVRQITPDSHFGIRATVEGERTDSLARHVSERLVYLGDFPDPKIAQDVVSDQSVAAMLAELHGTSPEDYQDIAWVVGTGDLTQWQQCAEAVTGRKLWETDHVQNQAS